MAGAGTLNDGHTYRLQAIAQVFERLFYRHNGRGDRAGIGNQIGDCGRTGKLGYAEIEIHLGRDQRRRRADVNTVSRIAIAIQTLQQARNIQHHGGAGVQGLRHIQRGHYALGQYWWKFQRTDKKGHRLTR